MLRRAITLKPRSVLRTIGSIPLLEWAFALTFRLRASSRGKARVGKWASQAKKGSQGTFGLMAPPLVTDWSIGTPTAVNTPVNRAVSIPAPATQWSARSIRVSDGLPAEVGPSGAASLNALTPGSGVQYKLQVAWWNATVRISEYTTLGTITTP